jgi:drug/metabolite transporter (DMT)-like permease
VGIVTITIRQIGRTEGTQTTVLWFSLLSMLVLAALLPFYARLHAPGTWAILAALGLFGGFGQIFLTSSLRFAPCRWWCRSTIRNCSGRCCSARSCFEQSPPATTWAGALVIIASGLYTVYREHRLGREKPGTAAL